MEEEPEILTTEDDLMLLRLIASLTEHTYPAELDYEGLMQGLDVVFRLDTEICMIWGHSLYISMGEEYFNRVAIINDLSKAIFEALHHFSQWYLKNKT